MAHLEIDIGHMPTSTIHGEHYFQVVVDRFSRMIWVDLMKKQSEAFDHFQTLYQRLRIEKPHLRVNKLIGDGFYDSKMFQQHAQQEGYELQIKSAYSDKAWLAERAIQSLRRGTMPTLATAGMNLRWWGYAMHDVVVVLRQSHTQLLPPNTTRQTVWEEENYSTTQTTTTSRRSQRPPWGVSGVGEKLCGEQK